MLEKDKNHVYKRPGEKVMSKLNTIQTYNSAWRTNIFSFSHLLTQDFVPSMLWKLTVEKMHDQKFKLRNVIQIREESIFVFDWVLKKNFEYFRWWFTINIYICIKSATIFQLLENFSKTLYSDLEAVSCLRSSQKLLLDVN